MDAEAVLSLDADGLLYYCRLFDVDVSRSRVDIDGAEEEEREMLQGMLLSCMLPLSAARPDFELVLEVATAFGETFEMARTLLDSATVESRCSYGGASPYRFTTSLVDQLMELQQQGAPPVARVVISGEAGGPMMDGCVAVMEDFVKIMDTYMIVVAYATDDDDCAAREVPRIKSVRWTSASSFSSRQYKHIVQSKPRLEFGMGLLIVEYSMYSREQQQPIGTADPSCCSSSMLSEEEEEECGYCSCYRRNVFVSSNIHEVVMTLDSVMDTLYWGWEGNWTVGLEAALLELLVAVEDDLADCIHRWNSMVFFVDRSAADGQSDMQRLLDSVQSDLTAALTTRSTYAVGRLHQTLLQVLEMPSSMMNIPRSVIDAIRQFIEAKLDASPADALKSKVAYLCSAGHAYLQELSLSSSVGSTSTSCEGWVGRLQVLVRSSRESDQPDRLSMDTALIVQGLRPQPFEVMLSSSSSLMFDRRLLPLDLLYMPVLPLAHLSSATLMTDAVLMMSQSLLGDVVNLQSLMGFSIDTSSDDTVAHSASIISTLLDAGLAYVTSDSGKLMGLFPALRSVLSLCSKDPISQPPIGAGTNRLPVGLQKRLRDMPRIFRNKVKRMLSFRINSDLDLAIRKLREHHGSDCWIGPALEAVWRHMSRQTPPQLLVFELWYGDELVAADFGHPVCHGASVYIATRFFERRVDCSPLMPGFLLALLECRYLQQIGCCQWDLGTANLCPLMRYKLDLTGPPISRPIALFRFREAKRVFDDRRIVGAVAVTAATVGTIIDSVSLSDLLQHI